MKERKVGERKLDGNCSHINILKSSLQSVKEQVFKTTTHKLNSQIVQRSFSKKLEMTSLNCLMLSVANQNNKCSAVTLIHAIHTAIQVDVYIAVLNSDST